MEYLIIKSQVGFIYKSPQEEAKKLQQLVVDWDDVILAHVKTSSISLFTASSPPLHGVERVRLHSQNPVSPVPVHSSLNFFKEWLSP